VRSRASIQRVLLVTSFVLAFASLLMPYLAMVLLFALPYSLASYSFVVIVPIWAVSVIASLISGWRLGKWSLLSVPIALYPYLSVRAN